MRRHIQIARKRYEWLFLHQLDSWARMKPNWFFISGPISVEDTLEGKPSPHAARQTGANIAVMKKFPATDPKPLPPDGGWGWMVVLGVSIVNLSTRPIEPSFGLLFGDLLASLSIATTGAGVIVSTYECIINFSGLFVGPLIKSYSFRKIALIGGLLTGLGLLTTYPAATMPHILCTYSIINGLGIGFSSSSTFVALNHYFKKKRGQAVGITMAGTGLGLLLMPQVVRYLNEEYGFAGSILILGGFALNACVGAALLQPVKWHLRQPKPEEGSLLTNEETEAKAPQIKITHVIVEKEEDADNKDEEETGAEVNSSEGLKEISPKAILKAKQRKWSMVCQNSLLQSGEKVHEIAKKNSLNKSSTDTKLDKYSDESKIKVKNDRKLSETTRINNNAPFASSSSINKGWESNPGPTPASVRRRKGSTISNLSNLDFHGSCLQIQAIRHEVKHEMPRKEEASKDKSASIWSRFSTFMDLDLLKDPIFLNILFGLSIFYVAELNFKMVVPFFLASLGHSKSETAFCLSMMAASDIVARIVLPPICDRVTYISRRNMFMIATIFCGASRSALAEAGHWIQLEYILVVSGFFRGATLINFMLVLSEYCDERLDKLPAAFGLHMVAKALFIAAFGPLIGLIRDTTNSYPLCLHTQTICILLCSIAWTTEYVILYCKGETLKRDLSSAPQCL